MNLPDRPRIKPQGLRKGDTIGIVAPASTVKRAELDAGCAAIRQAGYRPLYFDSIFDHDLYFAGSVERRVAELEEMFVRDDIRAIVCARGGYGSNYLLERLNWEKIKAHPKIFVGYSDQTSLLTRLSAAGMAVFHGPMLAKDWAAVNGVDISSWEAALERALPWELNGGSLAGAAGLVDGSAQGLLNGGCLSILVSALGTNYDINTAGTILFLEDVAEKPFRIDRMLMQLKLAGKLRDVRGIIFGEMKDCASSASENFSLKDVILRIVGDLGVPVARGLRSGHVTTANVTLPLGVRARLDVNGDSVRLHVLEGAVTFGDREAE